MFQHEAGALGVDPQRPLVVVDAEVGGDVEQVSEVRRQVAELSGGEVERPGGHADRLDLLARRGVAEAGDAPHLVVGGERRGEPERDPPAGPVIRIFSPLSIDLLHPREFLDDRRKRGRVGAVRAREVADFVLVSDGEQSVADVVARADSDERGRA